MALQIDATYQKLPFRFYGYYHGGTSGTIQALTFTTTSAFASSVSEFTEFLNGIEIMDEALKSSATAPPSQDTTSRTGDGLLQLNGGKMSVEYDPAKWTQRPTSENGRFTFAHKDGNGWAIVITERLEVPTDSLPGIALSNAQEADPNAKIVFKEKRTVAGVDVWFLKISAVVSKIPLTYYGYYYGGEAGTVQLLTSTGTSLTAEYEKDFMELLNGFRVSPRGLR